MRTLNETPKYDTEIDEVDDSFVRLAEGTLGQTPSPTKTAEEIASLDAKYEVPVFAQQSMDGYDRTQELLNTIVQSTTPSKVALEKGVLQQQEQTSQTAPEKFKNEKLSLSDFMGKYGSKDLKRDIKNGVSGYSEPWGVALDLYIHRAPNIAKVATGVLIPALAVTVPAVASFVASAGGVSAFVTNAGVASGFFLIPPVVAAGIVGVTAYKLFQTWRKERAFKKNFGKTVDQELRH